MSAGSSRWILYVFLAAMSAALVPGGKALFGPAPAQSAAGREYRLLDGAIDVHLGLAVNPASRN